MKKVLFTLCAMVFALVGCQSEVNILPAEIDFDAPDFHAEIADQTRTQLNDSNRVLWNDGDCVTIFKKTDHNLKYTTSDISESRSSCTFTYTRDYVYGNNNKLDSYYSVYPFREDNTILGSVISMSMPSIQTYEVGNEFQYVPMVAKSSSFDLSFKAPTSVMRVKLNKIDDPNDYILKSITLTSASQNLAGMVEIDMTQDVFKAVVNPDAGVASKSVMLDFEDGVALTTEQQSFFLPVPVVSVEADDLLITCEVEVNGKTFFVEIPIPVPLTFDPCTIKAVTVPALNDDDFVGSTEDQIGGDITDGLTPEDDGSFTCPITEDMILTEPLYLPESTTATIVMADGVNVTSSLENANASLIVVEEGADLTIEGNGSLSTYEAVASQSSFGAETRAASNTAFPIVVNGTLRIKGCDFTLNSFATSWLNCGIYIGPNGKLIIEGGRFRSTIGSYIIGHPLGETPDVEIRGGRFEGYDPADNDFDGNGSNYLEPEYASYYVAEDELVVSTRDAEWEVDNSYLLNSILKNGGNATLIDSVDENYTFFVDDNISVNYPVNIAVSGDFSKVSGYCPISLNTPLNIYADVNIKCDYTDGDLDSTSMTPDESLLYVISSTAIANVYNGATLTLGDAYYFGGDDEVSETMFNLYGGNVVINGGDYVISERIVADNMFVVGDYYTAESSLVVNGGKFYGFNPETVAFGEEVRNCVAEGLCSYEISNLAYGIYAHGSAFDVDNIYLLRSIFKKGGRANIYGKITIDESLEALNPVVVNMGGAFENELNYTGSDAMMKCYSDITLIADNDLPYIYSESVVAEVYENAKLLVALNGALVGNAANTMFVAYGGQIDVMSGIFQPGGGVGFAVSEDYPDSMISVYGGTYFNNYNPAEFVAEGYTVNEYDGYNEVVALAF